MLRSLALIIVAAIQLSLMLWIALSSYRLLALTGWLEAR